MNGDETKWAHQAFDFELSSHVSNQENSFDACTNLFLFKKSTGFKLVFPPECRKKGLKT